jgi:hypothetical protein
MQSRWIIMLSLFPMLWFGVWAVAAESGDETAQPSNASSFAQKLIDLQKELVSAQERGDAAYVRNALADDFTAIETNGGTTDKADLVRDLHPTNRPQRAAILYQFEVLQLDENCAVVTYNAVFPGKELDRYQHLSDTWVKQGQEWTLKFQQSTLNLWSAHDLD